MKYQINDGQTMRDIFNSYGRADQFSTAAFDTLHDFYSDFEDFTLDVISVCCEWCEYDSEDEARSNYDDLDDAYYLTTATGTVLVSG